MKSYSVAACGAMALHLLAFAATKGGDVLQPVAPANQGHPLVQVDDLLVLPATGGDTLVAVATDSSVHAYLPELSKIPLTCEKCITPKRVILSGSDIFVFDPGAKAVFQGDFTAPPIKLEVSQDLSQLRFVVSDVAIYRGV